MKLRIIILTAILVSLCRLDLKAQNEQSAFTGKQSLAQFVIDLIVNFGITEGIDTLNKYAVSDEFYLSKNEIYNSGHILYRMGEQESASNLFNEMKKHLPEVEHSMAHILFDMVLNQGTESADAWLNENRYSADFYLSLFELDRATETLITVEKYKEAKVLCELYAAEDLENDDAYFKLAKIELAEGNEEIALQHFRTGVATHKNTSFPEMASQPLLTYIPTVLPRDTSLLFSNNGNMDQDTAWLFVQGGPMPDLTGYYPRPLTLMPNHEDLLIVDVRQAQMINQSVLRSDKTLTRAQSLFEHNQSAEMMYRSIKYFKDRGKTVFVFGHSYGCHISFEYLNSKKNLADKLFVMGSDLDEDQRNFQKNEDGTRKFIRWRNGTEPYETDFWGGFPLAALLKPKMEQIFANTEGLVMHHSSRKFTELLKGKDLSNVVFLHARYDEANGRSSQAEIDFFEAHGVLVFETFGDHHSMLSQAYMNNFYEHLTKGKPLKKSISSVLASQLETKKGPEAVEYYHEIKDDLECFTAVESEINLLGYELVGKDRLTDAIDIFELNSILFPSSWNVYDSLAETYLSLGMKLLSKTNYQKSLKLNPGNMYAIGALRQMNN